MSKPLDELGGKCPYMPLHAIFGRGKCPRGNMSVPREKLTPRNPVGNTPIKDKKEMIV